VQPGEFEWTDLGALLRPTVELLQYDRRYRLVRFETHLQSGLPAVRTVPARLQQALSACMAAAADRLQDCSGRVTVSAKETAGGVECVVTDARAESAAAGLESGGADNQTPPPEGNSRATAVARAIVQDIGGSLVVERHDYGRRVAVFLPLDGQPQDHAE